MEKNAHVLRVGKDSAGPQEQVSRFPFSKVFWGRTPRPPSGLHCLGFIWQAPFADLSLDPCLEHHRNFRPVISAAFVGFLIKKS